MYNAVANKLVPITYIGVKEHLIVGLFKRMGLSSNLCNNWADLGRLESLAIG